MTNNNLRIAVLGEGFTWGGAIDFIQLCLQALVLNKKEHSISIILMMPDHNSANILNKLRRIFSPFKKMAIDLLQKRKPKYYKPSFFTQEQIIESFKPFLNDVELVFYTNKMELNNALARYRIDVMLPCLSPPESDNRICWVGYIYDFQHKYYPNFFPKDIIQFRERLFKSTLEKSSAVIVNSQAVANDVQRFYPENKSRIFCLPFAAAPVTEWFYPSTKDLLGIYKIPKKYFIISNQFWIHKDHITAIKAFHNILQNPNYKDIGLVCTGKTTDSRDPNYFNKILNLVTTLGLWEKVSFLGHIPKTDQVNLIKNSIAVIQPTLFEGGPGGGAVYNAVALGVPAILSDLPVNLEIRHENNLIYFKTGDSSDLACKMANVIDANRSSKSSEDLLKEGQLRMENFGIVLIDAINYAKNNS